MSPAARFVGSTEASEKRFRRSMPFCTIITLDPRTVTLDCSVNMARCFVDEATPYTNGVRDGLAEKRAVVPSIWPLEAATATIIWRAPQAAGRGPQRRFFVLLEASPIVVDDETSNRAFGEIVHLARTYQLSAHDAAYLEPAIRRGRPLACHDGKLKTAAPAADVALYTPA
jgi:predicted nucleic acid-binding protein